MTSLKEIEAWCYKQIELMNRLYDMKDFPGEVEFCFRDELGIKYLKRVHIFEGIDRISQAIKIPVHITVRNNHSYEKSVTHLGVKFYQIGHFAYDHE